ncbi:hypothetical protein SGLAM104S_10275 [Streptomyces glaucescens]
MKAFRLDELEAERAANEGAYLQFLRERTCRSACTPGAGGRPAETAARGVVVAGRRRRRWGGPAATREEGPIFAGLPWWVKWVAVPIIALVVFGGLIANVVGFVIGLLFKLLIFVALVGGLIYVVRKFTAGSASRGDW